MKWAILSVGLYILGLALYLVGDRTLFWMNIKEIVVCLSYLLAGVGIRDSIGRERVNYAALGVVVAFVSVTISLSLFGTVFSV